jgi:alpha-L-fucosidase
MPRDESISRRRFLERSSFLAAAATVAREDAKASAQDDDSPELPNPPARRDALDARPARFGATWASLSHYRCPEWFHDAKFGIYAHWGVFSAAKARGKTDWFGRNMYVPGHSNNVEHLAAHGSVRTFGYKDYVPLFRAEKFNADEWVDLYVEAGARFAGPVGEHADGFSMWDSQVNPWNAAKKGPHRDVVAEMARAVRRRGLKFLVSLHHQWLWGWYPTWDPNTDASDPAFASLYGPQYTSAAQGRPEPGGFDHFRVDPMPSREFQDTWLAKVKEVVAGYSPDLLWFDNRMQILPEQVRMNMAAFHYNHAAARNQDVVLTYKRPDLELGTATIDLERNRMPDIYPEPWLTDTSISRDSWAYATDLKCYSAERIVSDLVDIVSKNGCLLLNIAPHPDGTIPENQKERLRTVGQWLKTNGEAVYGTRPWLIYGEGPTQTPVGHLSDVGFEGFTSKDIRFTTKGETLYAIALSWPDSGNKVTIKALGAARWPGTISGVNMLGHNGPLTFSRGLDALDIELPAQPTSGYACVFKIQR